jgi:hypothetical protein
MTATPAITARALSRVATEPRATMRAVAAAGGWEARSAAPTRTVRTIATTAAATRGQVRMPVARTTGSFAAPSRTTAANPASSPPRWPTNVL